MTVPYYPSFSAKRVVVNYQLCPGVQFTIDKIVLPDPENDLLEHVQQGQENTLIASNNPISINTVDE